MEKRHILVATEKTMTCYRQTCISLVSLSYPDPEKKFVICQINSERSVSNLQQHC